MLSSYLPANTFLPDEKLLSSIAKILPHCSIENGDSNRKKD